MLHDPLTLAGLDYLVVLLAGVIAGATGRIVVFADLTDLVTTFSIVVGAGMVGLLILTTDSIPLPTRNRLTAAVAVTAVGAVAYCSWRQNGSIPAAALAVLTKLPFAAGVPLLAIRVAVPTGRTATERASARAVALLLLAIIAPLLLLLVRDREGVQRYLGVT